MLTVLHRGDRKEDGQRVEWTAQDLSSICGRLGTTGVLNSENPHILELHGVFGIGLIMTHEQALKLLLRVEYRPEP